MRRDPGSLQTTTKTDWLNQINLQRVKYFCRIFFSRFLRGQGDFLFLMIKSPRRTSSKRVLLTRVILHFAASWLILTTYWPAPAPMVTLLLSPAPTGELSRVSRCDMTHCNYIARIFVWNHSISFKVKYFFVFAENVVLLFCLVHVYLSYWVVGFVINK